MTQVGVLTKTPLSRSVGRGAGGEGQAVAHTPRVPSLAKGDSSEAYLREPRKNSVSSVPPWCLPTSAGC